MRPGRGPTTGNGAPPEGVTIPIGRRSPGSRSPCPIRFEAPNPMGPRPRAAEGADVPGPRPGRPFDGGLANRRVGSGRSQTWWSRRSRRPPRSGRRRPRRGGWPPRRRRCGGRWGRTGTPARLPGRWRGGGHYGEEPRGLSSTEGILAFLQERREEGKSLGSTARCLLEWLMALLREGREELRAFGEEELLQAMEALGGIPITPETAPYLWAKMADRLGDTHPVTQKARPGRAPCPGRPRPPLLGARLPGGPPPPPSGDPRKPYQPVRTG